MARCQHRKAGFSLVEIMIVVAIIGLLALIALPSFMKSRQNARIAAFVSDIRVCCDAFELYAMERGGYPPDAVRQTVPEGMAEYLPKMDWAAETPIGGVWDWDRDVFGIIAGVSVVGSSEPREVFDEIDSRIDDGSIYSGRFRRLKEGRYTYVCEE